MAIASRSKRVASDPLRMRLFRDLVLLIAIMVGILAGIGALMINEVKRDFAKVRMQDASTLVRDEVNGLLLPVRQQLLILRDGLRHRGLTPSDSEALTAQLMPSLAHIDQMAGVVFADDSGREYFLRREAGPHWITRERGATPATDVPTSVDLAIYEWNSEGERLSSDTQPGTHDPRTRPWFQAALRQLETREADAALEAEAMLEAPELVTWSFPYQFDWLREPGITVATAWREDEALRVLALDVTLARILSTLARFQVGETGQGFLFDREGGVYSPPTNNRDAIGFYNVEQRHGGTMVFEAIAAWREAGEPEDTPIRFESGGQRWWGGFVPLEPVKRSAWVGVVFPSTGPLGLLQQRWPLFAGLALAILALGIGLALLIVRRYSHRLRELPRLSIDRSQPENDLYDLIGRGESTHLEFKSTMRLNLRSGKNDKAIELAWLKGVAAFLNSEGGILLLGVADDGEVLGLAADAFANDDKCLLHFKNLVNQHLGAEAMRCLRFTLFWLDDKQIGAIECEPAADPVYLRQGNSGEAFLIRTGPSNSELPISRALSYIDSRF